MTTKITTPITYSRNYSLTSENKIAVTLMSICCYMKDVDNKERYIQMLTFQFVLDKDLNSYLVKILPSINMNPMGQVDDIIRTGVINGMLDLIEPYIEKIRTGMLAIPSLKILMKKSPSKPFQMRKHNSHRKFRLTRQKISLPVTRDKKKKLISKNSSSKNFFSNKFENLGTFSDMMNKNSLSVTKQKR